MIVSWEGFGTSHPSLPSFPFHVKKPYFLFASHYQDSRELLMSSPTHPTFGSGIGRRKNNWVNDFFFFAISKINDCQYYNLLGFCLQVRLLEFGHLSAECIIIETKLPTITVFKNHRKSLIHHCERSELRLQKFINSRKVNGTKIDGKCEGLNETFWIVFKQYDQNSNMFECISMH